MKALALVLLLAGTCVAQSILPQIADGGNWRTQVVLVNATTAAATVSLNFFQDTTGGVTIPWTPPFQEMGSTQNIQVPAGGTIFLHTPGTAATLTQGWGELVATPSLLPSVTAYAIYTYESFNGRPDQDGTSPGVGAVSRILVPFDNSDGFSTSMAIVNPNSAEETVSVNIQTDTGTISTATLPSLPANGQMAFLTSQQLPATAGNRGLLEFYLSTGTISIASFRFNPTLALTSSPAFPTSGAPIIDSTAPASSPTSNSILPQIADGGNWRTQVVLVNTSAASGTASLTFYEDTIGGATQPWAPPFVEVNNIQNITVPGGGTVFLHTPGTAAVLSQGWGQVTASPGIQAYAVYTYESFNGRPDQDGTSVAVTGSTRVLVPYDNTAGAVTSVAIVNPTNSLEDVAVNTQSDAGINAYARVVELPANGQMAFELIGEQSLPEACQRGLAEFYLTSEGSISISAFRFNPTLALTSSPTLPESGAPIIAGLPSGPYPFYINVPVTWSPPGISNGGLQMSLTADGDTDTIEVSGGANGMGFHIDMSGAASNQGTTFTFNVINTDFFAPFGSVACASLNFTLAQTSRSGQIAYGTLTGTFSVLMNASGGGGSFSGPITGTYNQVFAQ